MASGAAKLTTGSNFQKSDITLVATWVKTAWNDIPEEMVARAFLKFSISNAMDGTQDDAIYDEDIPAAQATTDKEDDDSNELDDMYDNHMQCTEEEFHVLFGDSDNEEPGCEGFDWTVLTYLAIIIVMFDNLYGIVVYLWCHGSDLLTNNRKVCVMCTSLINSKKCSAYTNIKKWRQLKHIVVCRLYFHFFSFICIVQNSPRLYEGHAIFTLVLELKNYTSVYTWLDLYAII